MSHFTACAATKRNRNGADPGIIVKRTPDEHTFDLWPEGSDRWSDAQWDGWTMEDGHGDLDIAIADKMLSDHGFTRTGDWAETCIGEWTAQVTAEQAARR